MRRTLEAALGVLAVGMVLAIGAPTAQADGWGGYGGGGYSRGWGGGYGGGGSGGYGRDYDGGYRHGGGYGDRHRDHCNPGPFPPRRPCGPPRPYYGGYGGGYVPVPVPAPFPVPVGVGPGLSISVGLPW